MKTIEPMKLLFVYNADKDFISAVMGYGHKVLMPSTYECALCELTYHNLGERKRWKTFRRNHDLEFHFMYKREFNQKYGRADELPAIYVVENEVEMLVSAKSLNSLKTTVQLIETIDEALSTTFRKKNTSI